MKRLWAGWRMQYVEKAVKEKGCLFCGLARRKPGPETLLIERDEHAMIVLNAFPYNCGHLMVAPVRHRGYLKPLTAAEQKAIWDGLRRTETALRREYRPHGINVGVNLGRSAGAGVLGHIHFHVVPRWNGDTNFMPVVADTKVLPESIDRTYDRLRKALGGIPAGR